MAVAGSGRLSVLAADTGVELLDQAAGDMLRTRAAELGDHVALVWEEGGGLVRMTFAKLLEEAERGAATLTDLVGPGSQVAIWAPNSPQWLLLFWAAALAGMVVVPLNPSLTDPEVTYALGHSEAALLATVNEFRGRRLRDRAHALASDLPRLRQIIDLTQWRQASRGCQGTLPHVAPSDQLLLQYTSGTTGQPKGAMLSHRTCVNVPYLSARAIGAMPGDVWLSPLPLYHVGGLVSVAIGAWSIGASYVVVPGFDAGLTLELLASTGATHAGLVPTMVIDVMAHRDFGKRRLALRTLMGGGSRVAPSQVRAVEREFGVRMAIGYGQSESPSITQTSLDDSERDKAETIGRPLPHREVCIVTPGTTEPVPVGQTGELCTRSPALVMDGYWRMPEETAATIDGDGWLHTGDLCSMDDRGVITFQGRAREVIIRGGENIYPREVEDAYLLHPAIADIAVIGVSDERWGETVAAFVRLAPGSTAAEEELRDFGRQRLASFKVPVTWRFVDDFPLTPSGKIKKYSLRAGLTPPQAGSRQT